MDKQDSNKSEAKESTFGAIIHKVKGACASLVSHCEIKDTTAPSANSVSSISQPSPLESDTTLPIINVHTNEFEDTDFIPKELWLGRKLYSFLLDLSSTAIECNDLERGEGCISEWENCLENHSSDFPTLLSVFKSIQPTFKLSKYLSFLKIWLFFLEQHGLIELRQDISNINEQDLLLYKNSNLVKKLKVSGTVRIKKHPWVLLNDSKKLVILPGELEVKNDADN